MGVRLELEQSAIVRDWQSLLESMNRVLCSYWA
jgi:hypothetical protein